MQENDLEDTWTPPSYAQAINDSDGWEPPSYATIAKDEEKPVKKTSAFREAITNLKPSGLGFKPKSQYDTKETDEAIKLLEAEGKAPYDKKEEVVKKEEEPKKKGFVQGLKDIYEPFAEQVSKAGKSSYKHIKKGEYPQAFHDIVSPVTEPFEGITSAIRNVTQGKKAIEISPEQAKEEAKGQLIGLSGIPAERIKEALESGDYPRLGGQGLAAAGMLIGTHKIGKAFGGGIKPSDEKKVASEPSIRRNISKEKPYKFQGDLPSEEPSIRKPKDIGLSSDVTPEGIKLNKKLAKDVAQSESDRMARLRGTESDLSPNASPRARETEIERRKLEQEMYEGVERRKATEEVAPKEEAKLKFVNPFEKKLEEARTELPSELRTAEEATGERPKLEVPDSEEAIFKNAQEKFNMGKEIPKEEWKPPSYAEEASKEESLTTTEEPRQFGRIQRMLGVENIEDAGLKDLQDVYSITKDSIDPAERKAAIGLKDLIDRKSGKPIKLSDVEVTNPTKLLSTKEEWKAPDYAEPVDEPLAARTSEGKLAIGADVKSLGKVLGTSLYKGDIAPIATKELLQNSIDAVRHLGTEGKIDVIFDRHNNTIHVADNGKGLTRQELESVFTDLGASGKREDVNAAGGFGLAKAAPLLGGEHVEVTSIARDSKTGNLIKNSFNGTPDELLEGVNIKQESVPKGTSTGTTVKVKVPKDSDFYGAGKFVDNLSEHSPNVKSQIRTGTNYGSSDFNPEDIFTTKERGSGTSLARLETPSASTELIEPKNSTRATRSYIELNLSNNGMYQGTKTIYFNNEVPNIPKSITVDIKSKVPEGHSDYPFTANRESLRGSVDELVKKYIDENIVKPSVGKRVDELSRLYNSMQEVTINKGKFPNTFGRKIAIYDPKGQITPEEMKSITSNPVFHSLVNDISGTLDEAMKVMDNPIWKERLEKVGIIFDDKVHGIHIPNPKTSKSAILINPFISIDKMSPDEASANILHTILHELAHVEPLAPGHNESFTVRLGDIYGKFGARRSVEAQDNIIKSISDPNTGLYHSEIQDILQKYKESRGREATQDDLLSGTGIGSKSGKGGQGSVPPGDKSDGTRDALDKLFNAMGNLEESRVSQDKINKIERARRFAASAGVKEEGRLGAKKSLAAMKGEFEKADFDKLQLGRKETDSLFTAIKKARITEPEKVRGYSALFKILNGESLPQRNELALLDEIFGNGFAGRITELHGGIGAVGFKLAKTANTMKAMRSSIDMSAPLRQGIGLIHRPEYRDAFKEMFKYFGDKDYYDGAMQVMEKDPDYLKAREAGLFLAKHESVTHGEEAFANNYIGNFPKPLRAPVEASERAYVGFLNSLRFDTFKSLIKNAESMGHKVFDNVEGSEVPTTIAENIAKYINVSTGRGGLGRLERIAPEMNAVLWSPRLISSRLSILNPKYYTTMDTFTRREAIKSLFSIAAAGSTVTGLGVLAGGKTSLDPNNSDFMKARFGNNVLDPFAGFQQVVVAASRLISGTANNKPQTRSATLGNFAANKLSPMAALAYEVASAQKWTGEGNYVSRFGQKKNISNEVVKSFAPMFIQDVTDVFQNDPSFAEQVGLDTASLFGMGVQNYPENKPKSAFRRLRP